MLIHVPFPFMFSYALVQTFITLICFRHSLYVRWINMQCQTKLGISSETKYALQSKGLIYMYYTADLATCLGILTSHYWVCNQCLNIKKKIINCEVIIYFCLYDKRLPPKSIKFCFTLFYIHEVNLWCYVLRWFWKRAIISRRATIV